MFGFPRHNDLAHRPGDHKSKDRMINDAQMGQKRNGGYQGHPCLVECCFFSVRRLLIFCHKLWDVNENVALGMCGCARI